MMPWPTIRDCLKQIQLNFKSKFNTQQEINDAVEKLESLESQLKRTVQAKQSNTNYIVTYRLDAEYNSVRQEVDNLRKFIQEKQREIEDRQRQVDELVLQHQYMCGIEKRRFDCQLEQEKQLICTRERIQSLEC